MSNPILETKNVSFAYSSDKPTLHDISLSLEPGQILAILGPNGSGKSTLIKVLLGHLRASGSILWQSRPLHDWSRKKLARRIAYLPQSPTHDPQPGLSDHQQDPERPGHVAAAPGDPPGTCGATELLWFVSRVAYSMPTRRVT